MKLSQYGQETIVNYNAGKQAATVYTGDKAVISKTYSFPKSYINYRKPRAVSTEQRAHARQMMIERNSSKKIKNFFVEI